MRELICRFWADDVGSVLTTEYLLLGSIISFGAAAGLQAVADGINHQAREYSAAVASITTSYQAPAQRSCGASKAGSHYVVPPTNGCL